ncbi:unnamed protein product [Cochlearia groenlandica]
MMMRGGIDRAELMAALKGKDTKMDKLRFAFMYEAEVDMSVAFQYVKKNKSFNVSLSASATSASRSNILDWAEKLYGQSISTFTAGVKNLLTSDQQLVVTRTVEALTEGKPNPEFDSYLMLDPRAPKSSSSSGGSHVKGPFREASYGAYGRTLMRKQNMSELGFNGVRDVDSSEDKN